MLGGDDMFWYWIIMVALLMAAVYFAYRYISLQYAIRSLSKECYGIQEDLGQNQMLHLPIPSKSLACLVNAFNTTLEAMLQEKRGYDKKERDFQAQIENISHDLRTPLTVILGYTKFMKQSTDDKEELLDCIEVVNQKAVVMRKLLSEFYEYSRLHTGSYEMELESVDLVKVLRETLVGHHQILEKAQLTFDMDLPSSPLSIAANTVALERIFSNLIQNVSRYASSYLRIEWEEEVDQVVVRFINDTSILNKQDLQHIFDRFYRKDSARKQDASGLGLTIAQSLAREMGADLEAYSYGESVGETWDFCIEFRINKISE